MTVLPYSHNHDIGGISVKYLGISSALRLGIGCGSVDKIYALKGCFSEDMIVKISAEACRKVLASEPYILIHVIRVYSAPLDILEGEKRGKHVILRGCGGKYHIYLGLHRKKLFYFCSYIKCRALAHFGSRFTRLDGKLIFIKGFHRLFPPQSS